MNTKEIIELSASVISSLATAAACVIALWQSRIQVKGKLKLKIHTSYVSSLYGGIRDFIGLDVINTGYTKIIIREWRIPLKKNKKLVLMPEETPVSSVFPCELKPGERTSLLFSPQRFREQIQNLKHKGLLEYRSKLKFEIIDNLDNIYSVKIPAVKEWIQKDVKNNTQIAIRNG